MSLNPMETLVVAGTYQGEYCANHFVHSLACLRPGHPRGGECIGKRHCWAKGGYDHGGALDTVFQPASIDEGPSTLRVHLPWPGNAVQIP